MSCSACLAVLSLILLSVHPFQSYFLLIAGSLSVFLQSSITDFFTHCMLAVLHKHSLLHTFSLFIHFSPKNATLLSRICAVAQYAVLEANGKVDGIGEISHLYPSQTLGPIWMPLQIYHYVPQGVDVQNLIKIDSAVDALRMREKTRFRVGFFVTGSIACSANLPVFSLLRGRF